jgi:hypothetical protein
LYCFPVRVWSNGASTVVTVSVPVGTPYFDIGVGVGVGLTPEAWLQRTANSNTPVTNACAKNLLRFEHATEAEALASSRRSEEAVELGSDRHKKVFRSRRICMINIEIIACQ